MRIDDLTLDELMELNELVCRRIDELRARQDLDVLKHLRLGQTVAFECREGEVFGQVVKINRKTVVIHADDHRQWKVPAGEIKPLHDIP
ncbi:MAG: transposase [Spiribacter salinus]|uniref:Transposase n=1 Tax=Spiribacter salinus TaxID=1335746 RepID=A0A540VNG9_9GAMM|nr:MAG: transposase [Spiribacter salinus]